LDEEAKVKLESSLRKQMMYIMGNSPGRVGFPVWILLAALLGRCYINTNFLS